jgi:hypothetical protein
MSNIAQVRESAISAETKVEEMFNRVLDRLHTLNSRLAELHDEIKAVQPVASGAVCLELYPCGKGCTGCPHPRWVKYTWIPGKDDKAVMLGINLDAQKKEPVLALARKDKHYKPTVTLIREAKSILEERSKLLACVRTMRAVAKV